MVFRILAAQVLCLIFAGCASPFPRPSEGPLRETIPSGEALFAECLAAHGGDLRDSVSGVRLSVTGEWGTLIQRIQPLVTDAGWRIESEETHWVVGGKSEVNWSGPEGTKKIIWDYPDIEVYYNGERGFDEDVLASTAMTTTAFQLFHLGPSFLAWYGSEPVCLSEDLIDGKAYYRLYFILRPGFGLSDEDEVVAYIDQETMRLFRVWITLEGFRTTKGASVDTTFIEYTEVEGFLLPTRFHERVRSPIAIHAHTWRNKKIELLQ